MKKFLTLAAASLLALLVVCYPTTGQDQPDPAPKPKPAPATPPARNQANALLAKFVVHDGGNKTAKDFPAELAEWDALFEKVRQSDPEQAATMLVQEALVIRVRVLNDPETAMKKLELLKQDYPNTVMGKQADKLTASIKAQADGLKIQRSLTVGSKFPAFSATDVDAKPLDLADDKASVVLVDFWATWCGPCVGELPNVMAAYQKFHAKGFDIIGISLDHEKEKLTQFTAAKKMPWRQIYDKEAKESLATKYGITAIPATILLAKDGTILARDLRGDDLEKALEKAFPK